MVLRERMVGRRLAWMTIVALTLMASIAHAGQIVYTHGNDLWG